MKKKIKDPNIKMISFANQDVIATSDTNGNVDDRRAKAITPISGIDCGF